MSPARFLALLRKHFAARRRRVWIGNGRAHIELRLGTDEELEQVATHLEATARELDTVRWVEVHAHTRRVVIAFRPGTLSPEELEALVAEAELRAGLGAALFSVAAHPADIEPAEQLLIELFAEGLGLFVGTGLKLSVIPSSRLAGTLASVLAVVRATPRLRRFLDERLQPERADLMLSVAHSLLTGLAQRPVSSLVGLVEKSVLLREIDAQRALWTRREPELCAEVRGARGAGAASPVSEPSPSRLRGGSRGERPRPMPRGPIEEYADRAWAVSLGGFGLSFLTTRSVQRAFGALFGALPRPARLGRESFSARLSRVLAARQLLVLDAEALRRLDRVDCLVLSGDLLPPGRFQVGRLICAEAVSEVEARRMVERLFDPEAPLGVGSDGVFRLGPTPRLGLEPTESMKRSATDLAARGGLVLGLSKNGELAALAEVQIQARVGLDELVQAAHDSGMRVVVATSNEEVLQGIPADDLIGEGEAMRRGVRRLQREGRVVCVVAQGDSPGLEVADLGIGLTSPGRAVPWSAHLLCSGDLTDVRFLIEAAVAAREVSRQSVNMALGAASVGALVSAGGLLPMTTSRVLTVVNLASLLSMGNGYRVCGDLQRKQLPPPRDPTPWHALEVEGALSRLGTSRDGLSRKEAALRRRATVGRKSALVELGSAVTDELFSPLAPLLAAGAGLSAVVGSLADAGMVGGVVGLNAVIGGAQRFRTERAITDLARATKRKVLVRREGELFELDTEELVKGDIVLLAAGDVVPADCRIVETEALEVDASGLTGESLPVRKASEASYEDSVADRTSMLYEGSAIASGQVTACVVAVGQETEARRGGASFKRTRADSGVERRLRELIDLTGPVALAAGVGVVGVGVLRGRKLEELVGTGVSLAVASVPEGLPLLATAAQLAAARRLSARGALVRNARSIEALGRVDTLCFDKTGTVTEGRIELGALSDGEVLEGIGEVSSTHIGVLSAALRASPARPEDWSRSDPMDSALWRGASGLSVTSNYDSTGWSRVSELPFEAGRSYHAVVGADGGSWRLSAKGAPEVLLERCTGWRKGSKSEPLDAVGRARLMREASMIARNGLRVLCVAERSVAAGQELDLENLSELEFVGFLALRDPVRSTAKLALERMREAGLRAVMITGDHPSTAEAIAVELGLSERPGVITGAELSSLSDDDLDRRLEHTNVFARVTPSQKVRVVRALQRIGRTVAMVGDGSNDAPAIRLANVGVAIGQKSAEAARNAADVVLTDERIETLVDAIAEGRAMWASVRDAVSILVGGNLGEIGFTLLTGLVAGRPPLSARQLLLVNVLTDVAPAMAIALKPPTKEALARLAKEGPEASLGVPLTRDIGTRAVITASGAGAAWILSRVVGDRRGASTTALLALVGTQLGQTLVSGGFSREVLAMNGLSVGVLAALVQTPGLSGLFGCRPLGPLGWSIAIGSSAAATAAGTLLPPLAEEWIDRIRRQAPLWLPDALQLPGGTGPALEET
jgi:cation-transporting ATPase I